ncbi:hypothetical protein RHMOL_Rhmol12G0128500 [Rhododendron molle]|uniref:Uncharacterized protein n=1 Tax=Rhododendron molle TaxID=49168 RepID=A0ACC0LHE7_RHOML|nr:hypothetical protein RHMOL_Rhmol12G0128500 [Rhododendron molle]
MGEKNLFMDFDFLLINQFVSTNLSIFLHGSKKSSPWSLRWDGVGKVLRHSALNGLPCRGLRERIDFCSLSITHYPKSSVLRCLHLFSSLLCVWCGLLFCFRQGSQAVRLRSVCVKLVSSILYGVVPPGAHLLSLLINKKNGGEDGLIMPMCPFFGTMVLALIVKSGRSDTTACSERGETFANSWVCVVFDYVNAHFLLFLTECYIAGVVLFANPPPGLHLGFLLRENGKANVLKLYDAAFDGVIFCSYCLLSQFHIQVLTISSLPSSMGPKFVPKLESF